MRIRIAFPLAVLTLTMLSFASKSALSFAMPSNHRLAASLSSLSAAATTCSSSNPLLDHKSLPKFSLIQPSHIQPAMDRLLQELNANFVSFESTLQAKQSANLIRYDDVLPELERMTDPISFAWGIAGHLNGVKNGDELRAAYESSQPKVIEQFIKLSQSRVVFEAIEKIVENEGKTLTQEQSRALEGSLRSFKNGGVGLIGADKVRFLEIKKRLGELSTSFSNNVLDATKAYSLTIDDPSVVDGVPSSAKGMWANTFNEEKGDAEKGPWKITLDGPSYIPAMQHVKSRSTRESLYRASVTRASEMSPNPLHNNIPLIKEILSLKMEMSNLLGFKTYADQSLSGKMAQKVEAVDEMSQFMSEKALPSARAELNDIFMHAKKTGGEEYAELKRLEPWDIPFFSERLKEEKFNITDEQFRPYFALPAVLGGFFELTDRLFGIEIKKAEDGEVEVWNKDVTFYKVYDKDSKKHIASFFLDPYSRPADKRGGAWFSSCTGKSKAIENEIPVAYLTCNGSPPVKGKPSLMTFREVETLFHEFGHGLQHMLTDVYEVGDVAGISGVEWDAVELPSQFMENWCYDRKTLFGMAKHYETNEALPEDLYQKLLLQKTYGQGMMFARQLYFGQLDMELHSRHDPKNANGESVFDVQKRVAAEYSPHMLPLDVDRFLCSFSHIFGGGYAAGYYSYKWAEVMSADAFSAFEEAGLDNEEEVQRIGRKFRKTVLGYGGGKPPADVFKEFRGRDPRPEALLRHLGIN